MCSAQIDDRKGDKIGALLYFKMGRFSRRHRGETEGESDLAGDESSLRKQQKTRFAAQGGRLVLTSTEVRHDAVMKG